MSMFHELMMRKKEEIMYATIKGTLTESPEGVFSGFSYNNYLEAQEEFDYSKDFEIVLKANTGDLSLTSYKVIIRSNSGSNPGASGCAIGIENTRLRIYIINSEGVHIANGSFGVSSFVNDADYFFKFSQKIDNGIYTIKLETSTDGINWTTENSWTSSLPIRNSGQGIAFGGGGFSNTSQYWTGSIDLNNSYIKINSTKYNLQAVVGYTIVGSPTITDGVVSGFSNSDYITTPVLPNNIETMHLHTEFTISSYLDIQGIFMVNGYPSLEAQYRQFRIYVKNSDNTTSSYGYQGNFVDVDEKVIVDFYYENGVCKFVASQNGENRLNVSYINTIISSGTISYGKKWKPLVNGTLDIGKTIIEINNKLWFNGQQS